MLIVANEDKVYKTTYENETVYSLIGLEGCVAVDISLGKGGTEAVVESVYSAMGSQNQIGPISNETLTLRYMQLTAFTIQTNYKINGILTVILHDYRISET